MRRVSLSGFGNLFAKFYFALSIDFQSTYLKKKKEKNLHTIYFLMSLGFEIFFYFGFDSEEVAFNLV